MAVETYTWVELRRLPGSWPDNRGHMDDLIQVLTPDPERLIQGIVFDL